MGRYNHYIGVDENGTPFIAHAAPATMATDSGTGPGRHKYLMKIRNALGKIRYIYNQAELAALNKGRRIRDRVKDKLGYDERDRRDRARANYMRGSKDAGLNARRKDAFDRAQAEYANTALGKYEYLKARHQVQSGIRKKKRSERRANARARINNLLTRNKSTSPQGIKPHSSGKV